MVTVTFARSLVDLAGQPGASSAPSSAAEEEGHGEGLAGQAGPPSPDDRDRR